MWIKAPPDLFAIFPDRVEIGGSWNTDSMNQKPKSRKLLFSFTISHLELSAASNICLKILHYLVTCQPTGLISLHQRSIIFREVDDAPPYRQRYGPAVTDGAGRET